MHHGFSRVVKSRVLIYRAGAMHTWVRAAHARSVVRRSSPISIGERGFTSGVSFSGSGLLIPFHLGVANVLQEQKIIHERSKFAGASGGSIVAAALACGVSVGTAMQGCRDITAELREKGAWLNMEAALRRVLEDTIPEDGATRCSGRVQVAITRVFPAPKSPEICFHPGSANDLEFSLLLEIEPSVVALHFTVEARTCRSDLIEAIVASCFIPLYLAPAFTTTFRDEACCDGGLIIFVPPVEGFLNVCVLKKSWLPASSLRGVDMKSEIGKPILECPSQVRSPPPNKTGFISPDLLVDPPFPYSFLRAAQMAMQPPSDQELQNLFICGENAARRWLRRFSRAPAGRWVDTK